MTRPFGRNRGSCRLLCALTLALCVFPAVRPIGAQDSTVRASERPRSLCWRGRPLPQCEKFMITEVAYHRRLVGSSYRYRVPWGESGETVEYTQNDLDSHFSWELGLMQNVSAQSAAGGTLMLGTGDGGARVALKGRYRHWIDDGEARIDLSAGAIRGYVRPLLLFPGSPAAYPSAVPAYGVTADAAFDVFDLVGVSARVELMRGQGHSGSAVYGGVRLGSYPAAVASAVAGAGLIYLIYAISRSD